MSDINLLPWREAARKQKKLKFYTLFITSVITTLLFLLIIKITMEKQIATKKTIRLHLDQEMVHLHKQLSEVHNLKKRNDILLSKAKRMVQLQYSRSINILFWNEIVRVLPPEIYLTHIEKQESKIVIAGQSSTERDIMQLVKNIKNSNLLTDPQLVEEQVGNQKINKNKKFQIVFKQKDKI